LVKRESKTSVAETDFAIFFQKSTN